MCELFGVSAKKKIRINKLLTKFFKHSVVHHNGWGLALLDERSISIEKEPLRAVDSIYLKHRLTSPIDSSRCMAHIRKATVGDVSYKNTHPFSKPDASGNRWVFVHNGTIFDSPLLHDYLYAQEGTTDSERILLYILDRINKTILRNLDSGSVSRFVAQAKFHLIDEIVNELTPGNKLNFLLYDGEFFYVHKNEPHTLFRKEEQDAVLFSTKPLDGGHWEEVEQNQLLVYHDGELIFRGEKHGHTYIHNEEKMRLLYLDHAML